MDSRLIENFRYERVFDKDVLKAIWSNRLDEDFEFDRKTPLSGLGCDWWFDEEKAKQIAEAFERFASAKRR